MTGVFLSYRGIERSYAPMFVDSLLRQRFGDDLVFEAGRRNESGTHFPASIDRWLDRCSVLVVFMDPAWLRDLGLLAHPGDWVRREILHFVERRKPILPLLLDGARMPSGLSLPTELAQMTKWIALRVSTRTVHADIELLINRLEQLVPDLTLAALQETPPVPAGPVALLRAEHEVFPFRQRPELAELSRWSRAPDGSPARLLIGPSGAGKTRLALRLCAEFRGSGHPAVVLPTSATPAALARLSSVTAPLLVVVDDAETRSDLVAAALRALPVGPTAARVLILARTGGEWLERERDRDPDDRIGPILDRTETVRLTPLAVEDGDYATACAALGSRLGLPVPAGPVTGPPPATLLELQAAALAALQQEDPPEAAATGTPWAQLTGLERERWSRAAATFGLSGLRRDNITEMMAATTIFGAADELEADALFAGLRAFRGAPVAEADAGRALVRTMLPGRLPLNPVEPQPLADEVVDQLLSSGYRLIDLLDSVTDDQARTAIIALGRCLSARPGVGTAVGDFIGAAAARLLPLAMTAMPAVPDPGGLITQMANALDRLPTADLERVTEALPQRSAALAAFAVELTRRALDARLAAGQPDAAAGRLSRLLATRMVARGGPAAEAVAAARAAVDWIDTPGAELAEAHAALAVALDLDPGLASEATEAGAVAIKMYRAVADEDRTRAALATALINQAHRSPRARGLAFEAYRILRPLHESRPNRYRALYADAVDVVAVLTRNAELGQEALRLRRALAAARPDAYRPALAATLFNLGVILDGAIPDAAIPDAAAGSERLWQESEAILAGLAASDPERYRGDLARVRARLADASR